MAELPFTITARLAERSQVIFTACRDNKTITSEKFAPGDGNRRRKVAGLWCNDDRLWDDSIPNTDAVVAELERVEFEALSTVDALEAQVEVPDNHFVAGSYADNGIVAELAWNADEAGADFVIYERATGHSSRATTVDTQRGILTAPPATTGIVTPGVPVEGAIYVPTDCQPDDGNEIALRRDIETFVNKYVELPGDSLSIVITYVFLTWIHDAFDELPYLAFRTADFGRGKSRALETVGSICYRPMFVGGGSSSAATLRLLDKYGGTLIADEFDQAHNTELASDLNRVLNQGFQRCRPLIKCDGEKNEPRPFKCFGPKVFALRCGFGDDATESRTLSIWMKGRTRDDIPRNLPRVEFDAEAKALRNRMLGWRFANYGKFAIDPQLADEDLEDRLNQIGLPLLAVAPDDETRERIVSALHDQQEKITAAARDTLAGEIFSVVCQVADTANVVRPKTVADEINGRRAAAENTTVDKLPDKRKLTPHRAGKILRTELELEWLNKDSVGAQYRLTADRREELCRRFGEPPDTSSPTSPSSHDDDGGDNVTPIVTVIVTEDPRYSAENGGCDVGDVGDVTQRGPALVGDDGCDVAGDDAGKRHNIDGDSDAGLADDISAAEQFLWREMRRSSGGHLGAFE